MEAIVTPPKAKRTRSEAFTPEKEKLRKRIVSLFGEYPGFRNRANMRNCDAETSDEGFVNSQDHFLQLFDENRLNAGLQRNLFDSSPQYRPTVEPPYDIWKQKSGVLLRPFKEYKLRAVTFDSVNRATRGATTVVRAKSRQQDLKITAIRPRTPKEMDNLANPTKMAINKKPVKRF